MKIHCSIRFLWLFVAFIFSIASLSPILSVPLLVSQQSVIQNTCDYDEGSQTSAGYDDWHLFSAFGYDSAAKHIAKSEINRTSGAKRPFAKTAEFLAADSAATETFYRTMSQGDYQQFLSTGQIPATGETFVSPSVGFSQQYNGVTVQFNVQAGTSDALMGMGVRNSAAGFAGTVYEGLPTVSSGWTDTSAFFKWEGGTVNIEQVSVLTIYTFAVDATSTTILKYAYDADNRLTNRWSARNINTAYAYDAVGNLTSVTYPTNHALSFVYNSLNWMTSMSDGVGTTTSKGSNHIYALFRDCKYLLVAAVKGS